MSAAHSFIIGKPYKFQICGDITPEAGFEDGGILASLALA